MARFEIFSFVASSDFEHKNMSCVIENINKVATCTYIEVSNTYVVKVAVDTPTDIEVAKINIQNSGIFRRWV